ncbi:MAG: antitoxin [Acidobacteria bacterium]|nr:antitoxin [Acidobacteriota bacterium]
MRTTIDISQPLLENAKQRARARGVTLSVLVEDAVRGQLSREQSGGAPEFRLHTVSGRLVNPELDLDRSSALLALDDEAEYAGEGQ